LIFGILSIAILGIAGVGLDSARGYSVRTSLQTALDAAMLAAAPLSSDPEADLSGTAHRFILANWRDKLGVTDVRIEIRRDGEGRLSGSASTLVPTTLTQLLGFDGLPVQVEAHIAAGSRDIEAVLVVDNTGSMAGAKLDALKSSARELVDAVFSGRNADRHARIGIVPFGQYVNVGMANRNRPWMSVEPDRSIPRQWCRDEAPVIGQSNCRMVSYTGYNDGIPFTGQYETCDYQYGASQYICTPWTETYTWYGCAGSREYPLSTRDESYSTPIPGVMNAGCPSPITPLTNDKSTLLSRIDDFVATGDTFIPSGLIWGWRVLSKDAPFDEAHDYNEVVNGNPIRKIMILMTDGANTLSATPPTNGGNDVTETNARTLELCGNVKAKGIELYTITFEITDNAIKDIMRTCASATNKFFDAANGGQLQIAFRDIARDMLSLHLAK
jgi:Mg-chelatase subunit ChlD